MDAFLSCLVVESHLEDRDQSHSLFIYWQHAQSITDVGKTEVVRILCSTDFSPKMTDRIRQCIMNGNEFENVVQFQSDQLQTKKLLLKHEPFDIDYASKMFIAEAKVNVSAAYYTDESA